jgi:hypothetical protein
MLELGPLTPAFLSLAISEFALGGYVLLRGRFSPVNRTFFWLAILAGTGSLLDLLVASLDSELLAVWSIRSLLFVAVLEMGVAYRLSILVPHPSHLLLLKNRRWAYNLLVLAVAALITLAVGDIVRDDNGWKPVNDLPFIILAVLIILYLVFLVTSLLYKWGKLIGVQRRQAALFSSALAIPAVLMIPVMASAMTGFELPRMYGLGEIISVVIVAYVILRYQLLIPPRVMEPVLPHRQVPSLTKGRAYLFEFISPDRMFESVVQEMGDGMSALIITRTHPDQLRARYHLTQTPFIWLAQSPGPDRVDPANIQLLTHMTMEYVRKGPSLIALEGLEHLILNNELNKVLRFLGQLRDEVIVEGSILLVSIDPRTLTERQKAILERELEVVNE